MKILNVCNEKGRRAMHTEFLEFLGHEIEEVDTGLMCLANIYRLKKSYGLIIMDLIMPQMNGFEVMERLMMCDNRPPVILFHGMDEEKVAGQAEHLDFYTVMSFPINFDILINHIERVSTDL